jgi:hypothetical protein
MTFLDWTADNRKFVLLLLPFKLKMDREGSSEMFVNSY